MTPLTEATEEEVKLAKIRAIRNLVGDDTDRFNLENMGEEDLDNLLAELNKASIQESNKETSQKQFERLAAIYKIKEKYGLKRDEAEIVLEDMLSESKKK